MITVALEVPVVGIAFLLSEGLTDRAIEVEDQLFERLAPMGLVDPFAREIHQRREIAAGTERLGRGASSNYACGSGFLVRLCSRPPTMCRMAGSTANRLASFTSAAMGWLL